VLSFLRAAGAVFQVESFRIDEAPDFHVESFFAASADGAMLTMPKVIAAEMRTAETGRAFMKVTS
jgi:hypothetical protein